MFYFALVKMVPNVLFHYTNVTGAIGITMDWYIRPSRQSGRFGPGVYMTDMNPRFYTRDEILKNNYGDNFSERSGDDCSDRADWIVKLFTRDLDVFKLRKLSALVTGDNGRSIYVYSDVVRVPQPALQVMKRPSCTCHRISSTSRSNVHHSSSPDTSFRYQTGASLNISVNTQCRFYNSDRYDDDDDDSDDDSDDDYSNFRW